MANVPVTPSPRFWKRIIMPPALWEVWRAEIERAGYSEDALYLFFLRMARDLYPDAYAQQREALRTFEVDDEYYRRHQGLDFGQPGSTAPGRD